MKTFSLRRAAYLLCALATLASGLGGMIGFVAMLGRAPKAVWLIAVVPLTAAAAMFLVLAGTFAYLAVRPAAWGKLLCVVGAPWICFSAVAWLESGFAAFAYSPLLSLPGVGGATLLVLGIVLLIEDRGRLVGP
jgi:ABC-type polysaccharide/polyol phosphate export permease